MKFGLNRTLEAVSPKGCVGLLQKIQTLCEDGQSFLKGCAVTSPFVWAPKCVEYVGNITGELQHVCGRVFVKYKTLLVHFRYAVIIDE